ncbi:unnamed protein product [Didymodactylos carnosus]|uniref:Pathogenicity locus n=1 Tax=Didymodactylos carnosus TaxID=1234261 RepID=A0A814YFH2_9BILA|nr:unnamed protein product [Didymodactylos carnosus]CAF1228450.1 unnamed protein product [Didymodactylos carnosus]CAF3635061.1 unnamed protein product [Didymodactylos carnosus]CAF3991177.1 unnamed protein product [Didymodactylos carnosus]
MSKKVNINENNKNKNDCIKELKTIPGVGVKIAEDLWQLGIRSIDDLCLTTADILYEKLEHHQSQHVDRCMLYVFRCIIYYASYTKHDKELLKWWNWTDEKLKTRT